MNTKKQDGLCDRLERDMLALQITRRMINREGMTAIVKTGHDNSTWEVYETEHPDMIGDHDRLVRRGTVP